MKSFQQFSENSERAQQLRQAMADKAEKFKKEGQAAVQKTRDDVERRRLNAKKKSLRDRMAAKGITDDEGLLDDDEGWCYNLYCKTQTGEHSLTG